jgi:hypothetical protein
VKQKWPGGHCNKVQIAQHILMYGTVQVVYVVTNLSLKNPPRPSTWSREEMSGDEIQIGNEEQYEISLE